MRYAQGCAVAVLMVLSGQAVWAQQGGKETRPTREEREARIAQESDKVRSLCEQLLTDKRLDPVRAKIAFSLADQTDAMRADTSRPTDGEREAIAVLAAKRDECLVATEKMVAANYPTPLSVLMAGQRPLGRTLLAALYEGGISYGEYAKRRSEMHERFMSTQNKIVNELNQNEANSPFVAAEMALRMREQVDVERRALRPRRGNDCLEFGKTVPCD